jgi:hypothetical protein
MNTDQASENNVIINGNVSSKGRSVRENIVIADRTVMGNMHIGHKKVLVPDRRDSETFRCTLVDRAAFAEDIPVADDQFRVFPSVFQILWRCSETGELKDLSVATKGCPTLDTGMMSHNRARTDPDFRTY